MAIRTGAQYIESLRDDRALYIDRKLVRDVTTHAPLKGVIDTIARVYDQQHDEQHQDMLTFSSPSSGDRVSKTYLEAKTEEEFRQLSACFHLRTQSTFGLMGRLTDFMSGYLMDQLSGLRVMGKSEAAEKAQSILDNSRENDLQVTHALVDPQSDKSKPEAPSEALHIVERRSDGVVVSGARMLSTLAPVANECYIGPYLARQKGEEDYALAFQIPMNTPGFSILGRGSFDQGEGTFDRPLTSRFDEGDAILVFEEAFIPNERLIVAGDLEAYNGMMRFGIGYTAIQACTRSTMKLRFLAGLATAVSRANGRDKTPHYQTSIGELMGLINVAEGIRSGAVVDSLRKITAFEQGHMMYEGDGLGEAKFQGMSGFAALNVFFPYAATKAADVLRLAAGSGVLAVTEGDYENPEVKSLLDRWLIGPDTTAEHRLKLMKLAWDMTGTEFGSRAGLYERLYSGEHERNCQIWFMSPTTTECEQLANNIFEL